MEITISFNVILQLFSLVFVAGGIYAWVRYKIQALIEHYGKLENKVEALEEQCNLVKNSVSDVRHESMPRDEAYKSFVAKEMMDLHLKNIEKNMSEMKTMLQQIHRKRSTDE